MTALTDQELMAIHVRALFTHDDHSRMLLVNAPGGGAPAPRFYFGRTRTGNLWRLRADLPPALAEELEALCAEEPVAKDLHEQPRHAETYVRLLGVHAPVRAVWMGPAFHFADDPEPSRPVIALREADADRLRGGFEELMDELPAWQPFLALAKDGRVVSVCRSVRITPAAHEVGVETLPEYRARGYAADVTAAWARAVRAMGATPLYSTSWDNAASRALANRLRLVTYGADFHVR